MRIFLTGGTGFVGRHLARRLCAEGMDVTALVRPGSDGSTLPSGARRVIGTLENCAGSAAEALAGADAVIHCAARLFAFSPQEFMRANVQGTENLARAVAAHGRPAQRVIHISSMAAAGPCARLPGRSEAAQPEPVSAYGWSKLMAEWAWEKYLPGESLAVLRPPLVYGPGDRALAPFFKLAARGIVVRPGLRGRPCSFLYVDDLADAVLLCLRQRASGFFHLEDGQASSLREFGEHIAAAFGRRPRHIPLPHTLLRLAACGCGLAARVAPLFCPLTPDKVLEARQGGWLADGAKARQELGFIAKTSLDAGIAATLAALARVTTEAGR